jgi:hypothetical protein
MWDAEHWDTKSRDVNFILNVCQCKITMSEVCLHYYSCQKVEQVWINFTLFHLIFERSNKFGGWLELTSLLLSKGWRNLKKFLPLVTLIPKRSNEFRGWFELIFSTTKMIQEWTLERSAAHQKGIFDIFSLWFLVFLIQFSYYLWSTFNWYDPTYWFWYLSVN